MTTLIQLQSTHWRPSLCVLLASFMLIDTARGDTEPAPTSPTPSPAAATDRQPIATNAKAQVWLCAGKRIADLMRPDAKCDFVKQHLTGIKLYIGQLQRNRRKPAEHSQGELRQLIQFIKEHDLQVAVELGGCLEFSPLDNTAGEWSARHELAAIEQYYQLGGRIDFLDIDGPIRRLMHPKQRRDDRRFETVESAADELIDALHIHRKAHPEIQYWLLTNFPNWGWRGDVSYHARGPKRQDFGDYDEVIRIVLKKLRATGIALEGVTVDNPYDYLIGAHRSVRLTNPTSVNWLQRVRGYEDFAHQQSLAFNLIVNSERGGHGSDEQFHRDTLEMVDTYINAGGRPTRWMIQSWYDYPKTMVPESGTTHSMTSLTKAIIQRVQSQGDLRVE